MPTPRKNFRSAKPEPIDDPVIGGNRGDMIAALIADRHVRNVDAVPFADLAARKLRHRDRAKGPPAEPRDQKAVGGAKQRGEIGRQRAHGRIVHDDDLAAHRHGAEHAQIEQQPAAGMKRKLDLLPKIAAAETATAHRNVAQGKFPRRRRREDFDPAVERGVFAAGDQSVDRLDHLDRETLHPDHGLGQKAAVDGNSWLHAR